jgi:hypothetical protein
LYINRWYLLSIVLDNQSSQNAHRHNIQTILYGPSWPWSYGSWIDNYLCNQCLSPLTLWVRIPLRRGVLDTPLCNKVCQWLTAGRWFSPGILVSSTNKADHHDITEIVLKVALNTTKQTTKESCIIYLCLLHDNIKTKITTLLKQFQHLIKIVHKES